MHKSREVVNTAILLILLLMIIGVAVILKTYNEYTDNFLDLQDAKQLQLAHAVDRNIELLLGQSRSGLEYILTLSQFQEAENIWLEHGDPTTVSSLFSGNPLTHSPLTADIIAIRSGEIVLSILEKADYSFRNEDSSSTQRICIDNDNNVYLALICRGSRGTDYAVMIDLNHLYTTISNNELTESDQLLLLDRDRSIMLHFCTNDLVVKSTLVEKCPEREDFKLLYTAEEAQKQSCLPFVYQTKRMAEGYNAHLLSIPTGESHNGGFAIGLVSNIDEALAPLKAASTRWLTGGIIILIGLALLLMLVLHFIRRDARIARELDLLRQKTLSMEELHRKTREMAHHQRLEMIGTLTSGIAHEFNNLITPIMGYSMLTLEQLPPDLEDIYDNVLEIYNSSQKARKITAQLLQYSRKNSSESREPLDPVNLMEKVLHVGRPACPETAETSFEHSEINAYVMGDETQLSQLFLNLIINAFHAMPEENGRLDISVTVEYGQVAFRFSDNGCGIPPNVLEHIFEPFYTTKEGGRGTGLGLAIAQQIAEEHHGNISVHSKEGEGTTFTVRLPAHYK